MMQTSDLRLISVWHGPEGTPELHFSLYNNGQEPIRDFTLCLTGATWLTPNGTVGGGKVVRVLSNFIEIRPEQQELANVWSFKLTGLYEWPRHSGDGVKSAYVHLSTGEFLDVAVQAMTQSQNATNIRGNAATPRRPATVEEGPRASLSLGVIPFPNVSSVAVSPLLGAGPNPILVRDDGPLDALAWATAIAALGQRVTGHSEPIFAAAEPEAKGFRTLALRTSTDTRLGNEGYKLTFDGSLIELEALDRPGHLHGLTTLAQLLIGARVAPRAFGFPVRGTITDVPRYAWRGLELDVARTYYPAGEVASVIDLAAWLKLNMVHLHLTDDEAWRIHVEGYPEIAEVAAWRGHNLPIPPLLGSSHAPYGGAYSKQEIDRLSSHAGSLGVALMPEVDVPGHGHAAITAIPNLREAGDAGGYHSIQGFFGNALNPCLPQTYDFLDAAFNSVAASFKAPMIHIGGDEIAADTWSQSPMAKAEVEKRNLENTGELQGLLIEHVHRRLNALGKRTVVWEDALHAATLSPESTTALVWQHPERAHELAAMGFDVVLAPGNAYYLDMATSADWRSPGGHWAGPVPLDRTYDFEPSLAWPTELLPKLKGVHACIWGEHMHDRRQFDALVFPRIFAYAERAWIDRTTKDYEGFLVRVRHSTAHVSRAEGTTA